jgi:hypothetical protein
MQAVRNYRHWKPEELEAPGAANQEQRARGSSVRLAAAVPAGAQGRGRRAPPRKPSSLLAASGLLALAGAAAPAPQPLGGSFTAARHLPAFPAPSMQRASSGGEGAATGRGQSASSGAAAPQRFPARATSPQLAAGEAVVPRSSASSFTGGLPVRTASALLSHQKDLSAQGSWGAGGSGT